VGKSRKDIRNVYPQASADAVSMLDQLLIFSPEKRLSVDQALAHSFLGRALLSFVYFSHL